MNTLKKLCPTCGNEMIWAYTEDGSMGNWCTHCKKSDIPREKKKLSKAVIAVLPIALYMTFASEHGRKLAEPLGVWGYFVPLAIAIVLLLATSLSD